MPVNQVSAHTITRTITESFVDPAHARRKESAEFRAAKRRLRADGHYRCWVCRVTKRLQAHHWACEWMFWPDADPAKVKQVVEEFDPYGYGHLLRHRPVETPDDIRNLLVLCSRHHIKRGTGVHELTMPTWLVQRIARAGMDPVPQAGA